MMSQAVIVNEDVDPDNWPGPHDGFESIAVDTSKKARTGEKVSSAGEKMSSAAGEKMSSAGEKAGSAAHYSTKCNI